MHGKLESFQGKLLRTRICLRYEFVGDSVNIFGQAIGWWRDFVTFRKD